MVRHQVLARSRHLTRPAGVALSPTPATPRAWSRPIHLFFSSELTRPSGSRRVARRRACHQRSSFASKKLGELERHPARSKEARLAIRAGDRHRRWRSWLLESTRRSLPVHAPATVLGPQDQQRAQLLAEAQTADREERPPRHLNGRHAQGCMRGIRFVRDELPSEALVHGPE